MNTKRDLEFIRPEIYAGKEVKGGFTRGMLTAAGAVLFWMAGTYVIWLTARLIQELT